MAQSTFGALETAVLERHHDRIASLVSTVDINEYSYRHIGKTLLHHAVSLNDAETTALLLSNHARVHCQDIDDATPLHLAPSAAIAAMLLKHGASVHARRTDGATPLHNDD
ncbi:hypothetical protein ACHHYP_07491 [Achlya hypogyna]|uniref:Uncharacterized protein n=1 Tax=Achlya hypogyna TaxID=1202772 RepID=A0A1V9ZM53_ACHHY|nr:hypothetical protein ACHHYP_07491 [Achlya hypogyna]